MPLIEIVEGEETSAETITAAVTFAQAIRKQPITCAEVPGFVVNRILNSAIAEVWREQEEQGLSIKAIDEGVGAAGLVPVGPYHLINLLGLDTVLHVAEHLARVLRRRALLRAQGHAEARRRAASSARRPAAMASTTPQGEPNLPGESEPDIERARRAALAEDLRRGLPRARGGRRQPPRHRLRHDGRRRPRPAPRPVAAVHARRRRRARHRARADGERAGAVTASASRRRRSCAGWSRRAGSGRRAGRASTPTRSPTPSSPPR